MKIDKTKFLWGLLILVFIIRVLYFLAQPDTCTDHVTQMALAENFMNGNGVSLAYVSEDDISKAVYKTNIQWPPAYIVVLSLLTFLTKDFLLSSFIIRNFSLLLLLIIMYKIFSFFKDIVQDNYLLILFSFVLITTSIYNNINTILVLPLVLTFLSFFLFLKYYFSEGKYIQSLLIASIISSLNFWFHYSYFILTFYIPIIMLFLRLKNKENINFSHIFLSFFIVIVIDSLLIVYNKLFAGSINYMENPNIWEKGLFLKNLLLIDPFFINSLFKTVYLNQFFLDSTFFRVILHFFSFLVFISIWIGLKKLYRILNINLKKKFLFLLVNLLFIFLLNILILLFLSLHYYEIPRPGWTHIGDPRYLSISYLVIILIIFIIGYNKINYDSFISKIFRIIFISFLFLNIFLNVYNVKINLNSPFRDTQLIFSDGDLKDLYCNIKKIKDSDKKVVFIDNGATVRQLRMAAFAGAYICDSNYFLNKELKTSQEIACIFPILFDDMRKIDIKLLEFGEKNNFVKIGEINNQHLYKIYLKPNDK